jgi:heme exporter protein D
VTWTSVPDFFSMHGYGLYVWGSYAVTAALMLGEPWLARRHRRQALRGAAANPARSPE